MKTLQPCGFHGKLELLPAMMLALHTHFFTRLQRWLGPFLVVAAVLVGAWLRLQDLTLKPLHNDEGVNGWFLEALSSGLQQPGSWAVRYTYDPHNYHGPWLYFAGLPAFLLLGPTPFALRVTVALAGIACIPLVWPLRRWLGMSGTVTAAWLLALSPSLVFFARTAIHETWCLFFSLLAAVALVRTFAPSQRGGTPHRPVWLGTGCMAGALLWTTKETAIITFASLILAGLVAWFAARAGPSLRERVLLLRQQIPQAPVHQVYWLVALALAAVAFITLYTSFFTNPQGLRHAFTTYATWTERGADHAGGHAKPFAYWPELLWEFETPVLLLALVGTVCALWRRERLPLFAAVWAWSTWAVYSAISYKTPWLALNMLGPMCLLAGVAVQELSRQLPSPRSQLALLAALPVMLAFAPVPAGPILQASEGLPVASWMQRGWDVNFETYDDAQNRIVYVQTVRGFQPLVSRTHQLFRLLGPKMRMTVTAPHTWPFPFSALPESHRMPFQPSFDDANPPDAILSSAAQDVDLSTRLPGYHVETFPFAQGDSLSLHISPAAWAAVQADPPTPP